MTKESLEESNQTLTDDSSRMIDETQTVIQRRPVARQPARPRGFRGQRVRHVQMLIYGKQSNGN